MTAIVSIGQISQTFDGGQFRVLVLDETPCCKVRLGHAIYWTEEAETKCSICCKKILTGVTIEDIEDTKRFCAEYLGTLACLEDAAFRITVPFRTTLDTTEYNVCHAHTATAFRVYGKNYTEK